MSFHNTWRVMFLHFKLHGLNFYSSGPRFWHFCWLMVKSIKRNSRWQALTGSRFTGHCLNLNTLETQVSSLGLAKIIISVMIQSCKPPTDKNISWIVVTLGHQDPWAVGSGKEKSPSAALGQYTALLGQISEICQQCSKQPTAWHLCLDGPGKVQMIDRVPVPCNCCPPLDPCLGTSWPASKTRQQNLLYVIITRFYIAS